MKIPYDPKEEAEFWRKCAEEAELEKHLTDEHLFAVDRQIKQFKVDRSRCLEDHRWPDPKK